MRPAAFALFAVALLFAAGCQTTGNPGAKNAAEAVLAFQDSGLTLPPRQVDDVLTLIAARAEADRKTRLDAEAVLAEPLDPALEPGKKAQALLDRGRLAHRAGDSTAERALYREALAASDASDLRGGTQAFLVRFELGRAEVLGGNLSDGIAQMRAAPALITGDRDSDTSKSYAPIPLLSFLAMTLGDLGDLAATRAVAEDVAKRYQAEARWFSQWPPDGVRIMKACLAASEAAVARLTGRVGEAETLLRGAIEDFAVYERFPVRNYFDYDPAILDLFHQTLQATLADLYREQGRHAEAEALAREALAAAIESHGTLSAHTADMLRRLARTILHQNRVADARRLVRAGAQAQTRAGVSTRSAGYARMLVALGETYAADGDWPDAQAAFAEADAALTTDPVARDGLIARNIEVGIAALRTGDAARAARLFERLSTEMRDGLGPDAYEVRELDGLTEVARLEAGTGSVQALAAAANRLAAIPVTTGTDGEAPAHRLWRRRIVLESHLGRLTDDPAPDGAAARDGFAVATALSAGSVERSVAYAGARARVSDPALADLLRREQDVGLQLTAVNRQISAALFAGDPPGPLRAAADELRTALTALRARIDTQLPHLAELVAPKPVSVAEAASFLTRDEALIATYFADDAAYSWAVRADGRVSMHRAPMPAARAAAVVEDLRRALDPAPETLSDIPAFNLKRAHELYATLLGPHEALWDDATRLVVATHGPLGFLPVGLLPRAPAVRQVGSDALLFAEYRAVPWLIRSHAVATVPSVGTLRLMRAKAGATAAPGFIGFGDPVFSPAQAAAATGDAIETSDAGGLRGGAMRIALRALPPVRFREAASARIEALPRLEDTADELRDIAATLAVPAEETVFLGHRASETAAKNANYTGIGTLAFATHGLLPGDLDGLTEPALALSAPSVVGGPDDGLLTASEILGLSLEADWVILSACNTGSGYGRGAEAVSGLGRSFFYAGARSLLASNWPVHSRSARDLTTAMFRAYRDGAGGKAQALRHAMLSLMDGPGYLATDGQPLFSYAHPIFWAPFSLIGGSGSTAAES